MLVNKETCKFLTGAPLPTEERGRCGIYVDRCFGCEMPPFAGRFIKGSWRVANYHFVYSIRLQCI